MGLSGLIGAGASNSLDEIIAQQLLQAKFEEAKRAQAAEEAQRTQQMAQQASQFDRGFGLNQAQFDEQKSNNAFNRQNTTEDRAEARQKEFDREVQMATMENSPAYPATLRRTVGAFRRTGMRLDPSDLMTPDEVAAARHQQMTDQLTMADAQAQIAARYREPKGPTIVPADSSVYDPKTGTFKQAPAKAGGGSTRPVTGSERQALNFYNRGVEGSDLAKSLEQEIGGQTLGGQLYTLNAPNFATSQTGQSYRAAQRRFTEARLRKESGAAVPQSEYDNDARTYFAQPGDTPTTIAEKQRGREKILTGIKNEARRAIAEFNTGEPDNPNGLTVNPGGTGESHLGGDTGAASAYDAYLASRKGKP